jgi:hypothetical protein
VERSADDLAGDLLELVASDSEHSATHFEFVQLTSILVAYALECALYHQHRPTLNLCHPKVPAGRGIACAHPECPFAAPLSGVRDTVPPVK